MGLMPLKAIWLEYRFFAVEGITFYPFG